METNDHQAATNAIPTDTDVIQNLDQFAYLVGSWFDSNHKQLQQALNVPDGQSITVQLEKDAASEELILTGDALKGFKAGLIVAINIFGQLPFGGVPNPDAEAPAEAAPANDPAASGN